MLLSLLLCICTNVSQVCASSRGALNQHEPGAMALHGVDGSRQTSDGHAGTTRRLDGV